MQSIAQNFGETKAKTKADRVRKLLNGAWTDRQIACAIGVSNARRQREAQ